MRIRLRSAPVECVFDPSTTDDAHLFVFPGLVVETDTPGVVEFGLEVEPMRAYGMDPNPEGFVDGEDHPPLRVDVDGTVGPLDLAFAVFAPEVAEQWTGVTLVVLTEDGEARVAGPRGEALDAEVEV